MSEGPLSHWQGEPVEVLRAAWGVRAVEAWARIGSTSDRAKALAADGAEPYTVVVADEQTAGRGRRGTTWHSAPGAGLWLSVVLPEAGPALHLPLLVGLAAAEALEATAPGLRVGIKWPNDLLASGGKLGGVLCEAVGTAVVAGVGLNVRTPPGGFPEALAQPATSAEAEVGAAPPLGRLAGVLLARLRARLPAGAALEGDALAALRGRDVLAGRPIASEEHGPGTALGLEPDGALALERPDGSRVRVLSGSVRPV